MFAFFLTISTDIIVKLQNQPPPSHENHHVSGAGLGGGQGECYFFFGIDGGAFQVFVEKPSWVGGKHLNDNLYLDACSN